MSQIKILSQPHGKHLRSQDEALIPELSVVIPTFKERGNIEILVQRLNAALSGIAWRRRREAGDPVRHPADPLLINRHPHQGR